MISLKGSRFLVSYDPDSGEHAIFTQGRNGCTEITGSMSDEEKDELINDLAYALSDLLAKQKERNASC